ncbi:MAG: hypothetical protein QME66_08265 [Candidatus Eisenbacteria bacterium]|nr:hypothetical protein [Candidatus Eisenbacteria bacterium]
MAAPAVQGKAYTIFTAAGQTLAGASKVSTVSWYVPSAATTALCGLRFGAVASPDRIVTLAAAASTTTTVIDTVDVWGRNLNVGTLTRGVVTVRTSRV